MAALHKTTQKTLLKHVERYLYARRSSNIARMQNAYDVLYSFCDLRDIDMSQAIEQGTSFLRRNRIAPSMNGIV